LVEEVDASLLLDCGPGVLARLRTRGAWPDTEAVVITHFHLDHWGDLVPWVWGAFYLHRSGRELRKTELWVPVGGRERLAQFGSLLGFPGMFDEVFVLGEYAAGVPFAAGGCEITATAVPHYTIQSHALRLDGGARTLVYSGDSGPSSKLVEAARDADLFVCEATLHTGEDDGLPRGHLSLDEAVATFEASGARELLVTHRPVELDVPVGIALARDGLVRPV